MDKLVLDEFPLEDRAEAVPEMEKEKEKHFKELNKHFKEVRKNAEIKDFKEKLTLNFGDSLNEELEDDGAFDVNNLIQQAWGQVGAWQALVGQFDDDVDEGISNLISELYIFIGQMENKLKGIVPEAEGLDGITEAIDKDKLYTNPKDYKVADFIGDVYPERREADYEENKKKRWLYDGARRAAGEFDHELELPFAEPADDALKAKVLGAIKDKKESADHLTEGKEYNAEEKIAKDALASVGLEMDPNSFHIDEFQISFRIAGNEVIIENPEPSLIWEIDGLEDMIRDEVNRLIESGDLYESKEDFKSEDGEEILNEFGDDIPMDVANKVKFDKENKR